MKMSKKEREQLINYLDNLKVLVKNGEVGAIVMAYKLGDVIATPMLGQNLELHGLTSKLSSTLYQQEAKISPVHGTFRSEDNDD